MAEENPFQYSTKRHNSTTGLVLYEYRVYSWIVGRWVSGDPEWLPESGGLHVSVRNDAANRFDLLGLKDFGWEPPIYNPNGSPVPKPTGEVYGGTKWHEFKPVVKLFPKPDSFCCYGLMFNGEYAQLSVWWARGDRVAREHELDHVTRHFHPAYLAYKAAARALFTPCRARRHAECFAKVITGPLAEEHKLLGRALAIQSDCDTYGEPACSRAAVVSVQFYEAAESTRKAVAECLSHP